MMKLTMDVVPTSRTRTESLPQLSDLEIRKLRALPYADYLQTTWWRIRRDRAIRRADGRCTRCDEPQELQVHHRTYANLGAEADDDLEVVCRACHEGHHFDTSRKTHTGVYVNLVAAVMRDDKSATLSDITEVIRQRCVHEGIPYDAHRVWVAMREIDSARAGVLTAEQRQLFEEGLRKDSTIGRQEAVEIMKRLGIQVGLKSIPRATYYDVDAYRAQLDDARALDVDIY
jgi:hypothetical protein